MAMKKKFLGLAMAAMVALTAAAYADTTVRWDEGGTKDVEVTVRLAGIEQAEKLYLVVHIKLTNTK